MYLDVREFQEFYRSPLGALARRLIARHVRARWENVAGLSVAGLGFAAPYLTVLAGEAERALAVMPAAQGVVHWPAAAPYRTVLADEYALPLADASVDRILLVHLLEFAQAPENLMREVWRVLASQGRLIAVVPNRRGLWARADATPFGSGRPYSRAQLNALLKETLFNPLGWAGALAMPPFSRRYLLRSAPALERVGGYMLQGFEGALVVEADKQMYQPVRLRKKELAPGRFRPALAPPAGGAARQGRV